MQKIIPFLWFDGKAEEAVNFYTSIFKNSKILSITQYGEAAQVRLLITLLSLQNKAARQT